MVWLWLSRHGGRAWWLQRADTDNKRGSRESSLGLHLALESRVQAVFVVEPGFSQGGPSSMEKAYDERWRRRRPVWTYRRRRPWRATCSGNESAQTSALPYSGGRLREDGAAFAATSTTYCMVSACAMNAKEVMETSSFSPTPVF